MLTLDKAREWLRLDGTDNDTVILGLLAAIPEYIEETTGMTAAAQATDALAETAGKFLLTLWYHAEQSEAERLQRAIDGILKVLTIRARTTTSEG